MSRELKKEGPDWFAVWSSQSKKQLDVQLVHTLNHETYVLEMPWHLSATDPQRRVLCQILERRPIFGNGMQQDGADLRREGRAESLVSWNASGYTIS